MGRSKRAKYLSLSVMVIMAIAAVVAGCSKKQPEPTQVDIVKAVIQHAVSENCSVMTPTIRVVEKGKLQEDGAMPCKVRYTCMGLQQNEREVTLNMYRSRDSADKPVWLAR